jgi:hypothetical protein
MVGSTPCLSVFCVNDIKCSLYEGRPLGCFLVFDFILVVHYHIVKCIFIEFSSFVGKLNLMQGILIQYTVSNMPSRMTLIRISLSFLFRA